MGPAKSMISDNMESNEVTNYKAIMTELVNKISQSVLRMSCLRFDNLVIFLGKTIKLLVL